MLLGVLVNNRNLSRLTSGSAPSGLVFLVREACDAGITAVIFSPRCVDWWSRQLKGIVFNKKDKVWAEGNYPFPDVIYDRATFTIGDREAGNLTRKRFREEYGVLFLNNKHAFGKWETHRTLSRCGEIRAYLPDTCIYKHQLQIDSFLKKYGTVYVKASNGSLGREVYKIQQEPEGEYLVGYRENGRNCFKRFSLQGFLSEIINGRLEGRKVIIQQGINLECVGRSPFDIRLLVQKNGEGSWEVVDKAVRVAAPGSVVTNVSSGGEVKKLEEVLAVTFPSKAEALKQEIDEMALSICRCLEERYGRLCELGMDVALDKNGRLWLLEVNGKPAKVSVRRSQDKELIHRAYSNPVKYFKYLCEYEFMKINT